MTLHVPSLLATETAKCSRAVNALRTCARDRDRARVRGQQAAEEEKEANDTVEVRPRALAAGAVMGNLGREDVSRLVYVVRW